MYWNLQLSKNKSIETQIEFGWNNCIPSEWFIFEFGTRTKQDHGGIYFCITLLKIFSFDIKLYDHRHWDEENDRYCIYDGEGFI